MFRTQLINSHEAAKTDPGPRCPPAAERTGRMYICKNSGLRAAYTDSKYLYRINATKKTICIVRSKDVVYSCDDKCWRCTIGDQIAAPWNPCRGVTDQRDGRYVQSMSH